jgi:hypothetical protein
MNQGQFIVNMHGILLKLEKATRSSNNVDYKTVRNLCMDMQEEANYLWNWAMEAENAMPIEQWRKMMERHSA